MRDQIATKKADMNDTEELVDSMFTPSIVVGNEGAQIRFKIGPLMSP